MWDQRRCEELRNWREILDDPLTRLLMQADRVEYTQLRLLFSRLAASPRLLRRREDPAVLAA